MRSFIVTRSRPCSIWMVAWSAVVRGPGAAGRRAPAPRSGLRRRRRRATSGRASGAASLRKVRRMTGSSVIQGFRGRANGRGRRANVDHSRLPGAENPQGLSVSGKTRRDFTGAPSPRGRANRYAPPMRYISTRGQAAPRDFEAVLLAGPRRGWRAVRARDLAGAHRRRMAGDARAALSGAGRAHPGAVRRPATMPLRADVRRGLCRLRPPGRGAAGAAGSPLLRAGAVPRPDAGLQGHGAAAARAAVRPRAGQARGARDDRRRDLRRHRLARPSRPAATARAIDIVILHPEGRTSEVQRRQMTTRARAQRRATSR